MSEEQALLDAIIASPDDDLPRLVYADWLDDRGEADRAEFIRVQCRIAAGADWRRQLGCRSGELLAKFGGLWGDRDLDHTDDPLCFRRSTGPAVLWERGLVARVRGPLAAFWEGRDCGICDGGRLDVGFWLNETPCSGCGGSRRVSGPTAAFGELLKRNPVEHVDFTDKEPLSDYQMTGGVAWFDGSDSDPDVVDPEWEMSDLPATVFVALEGGIVTPAGAKWYATYDAARQALSDAMIRLGRATPPASAAGPGTAAAPGSGRR